LIKLAVIAANSGIVSLMAWLVAAVAFIVFVALTKFLGVTINVVVADPLSYPVAVASTVTLNCSGSAFPLILQL
jgi:hypothetical protein